MNIKDILESTVAGSIASVAKPLGELQTRSKPEKAPKVTKGKKYANTISEGAVKRLAYDLIHMDPKEFQEVYKTAKEFFKKPTAAVPPAKPAATSTKTGSKVWHDTGYTDKKAAQAAQKSDEKIQEDELKEEDLIILPGMLRGKDKSFVPREYDRRDHEVEMARSDVYAAAKDAMRILKILQTRSEDEGLMGWQQSYITLASDYLNSVADSLDYDAISNEGAVGKIVNAIAKNSAKNLPKTPETHRAIANQAMKIEKNLDRAVKVGTAAVGGAAGKEVYDKSKKTNEGVAEVRRYYDPMGDERREQDAMDQERRDFKRREMEYELRGEKEAERKANEGPWYIRIDGKLVRDKNKDPYVFSTLEAARKAAQTMMKKDWNKGKQFSYSRTPTDAEKKLEEKKDACYSKVKSRYKVWPSAYASGALSKCRKVGAANWGNSSKK